jgi:hypothetical protein
MSHATALACVALAASVFLVIHLRGGVYSVTAVVVSGVEVLMATGLLHFSVGHLPLGLILGAVLLLVGIVLYVKVTDKHPIGASTLIAAVGAIQVLQSLHKL